MSEFERETTEERPKRSDPHYVEQFGASSGPMPLRFVPLSAIDEPEWVDPSVLAPLVASIRDLGLLHPLLLRAEHGRYQVIAGRKRFHAAVAAGLSAVPCFVHHVQQTEAEALAHADNLQFGASSRSLESGRSPRAPELGASTRAPERAAMGGGSVDLFRHLSQHLEGITSARLLLVDGGTSMGHRPALDLIQAHATRARWLIEATSFVASPVRTGAERQTLGTLVDDLVTQFSAESRLTNVPLRTRIDDRAYSVRVDKQAISVGLLGAIVAVLPFVDAEHGGALTVTTASGENALTIEIGHAPSLMDHAASRSFFDASWSARPGGWPSWLGALALKTAVESCAGSVVCESDPLESRIRLTLPEGR